MSIVLEITNIPVAYLFLGVFALCIGSLLNVIIYRLPLMLRAEWRRDCLLLLNQKEDSQNGRDINLFFPRSFCPHCKTMISAWHNIPIFSYLFLRGRCSHCQAGISLRYPFVELLTCLLSLFAAWQFGFGIELLFILPFIWILISLFFIDMDEQLLPDSLTIGLLWLGLIANTMSLFTPLTNAVLSAALAYLCLWLIIKIYYLLRGKIGMGNGDFKLFAALAAWFGASALPMILMISSIAGIIWGLVYLKLTKKSSDTPFAFGPFLCITGLLYLFWGKDLVHWYYF